MVLRRNKVNRREFLKLMGTFAATSAVAAACAPEQVPGPDPTRTPAPVVLDPTGVPPEPVLPPVPLGIIALNRMAYGPRPGDLEAFHGLGATDKGRHPAKLNFGDCFAYALSNSRGLPLLWKGDDFGRTDIDAASYESGVE